MRGFNSAKAVQVFRLEYIQWITNPKLLTFVVLLVFIRELVMLPIMRAADMMEQPINMWEPCIAIGNSGIILLFLPIFYIMLMSDFPKLNNNMYYFIPRVGRINWFIGQVFFQVAATCTYLFAILVSSLLQIVNIAYGVNAWSLVTTHFAGSPYASSGIDIGNLIPLNLYYQMAPFKAFAYTYILLFFYLMLWGCLMLLGFMYGKKVLSFFLSIVLIGIGMGFTALKSKYMWYFPSGHAILWIHCQRYYREFVFPPMLSIGLFCVACVILLLLSARKFTRVNLDTIMENS